MADDNDLIDDEEADGEEDVPLYVNYLFDDYFVLNEDHLRDLLTKLISSTDKEDKYKLDNIIEKITEHSDREAFRCLLECGYKIEVLNVKGETAIHLARENRFIKDFCLYQSDRELLENSIGNMNNYADYNGLSLLHIACEIGYENAVKKFLENKVHVNDSYLVDSYGDEECEIYCNENGFTPLHFAVKNLRFGIVKLLLENGANVNATDILCRTPLHVASQIYVSSEHPARDLEVMELLLEYKSNVNAKDAYGNIPLHAIFGEFERSDWLLSNRREKQMKKLEILMKYGADIKEVNNDNDTVLHHIIKDLKPVSGPACDRIFSDDSHQVELITKILNLYDNLDINAKNKQGKSPLDLAISHLSSPIVAVLLQHKAHCKAVKFTDEKTCIECRRVAPNYDQVLNLTTIIELLTQYGFEVTSEDNMAILKFLVHNFDDCECWHRRLHKTNSLRDNVTNLLHYGSAEHIGQVFKRLISSDQRKSYAFNDVILDIAAFYLKILQHGNMFVHRQIDEGINNYVRVNDYNMSMYSNWHAKLSDEIQKMKSTILKDSLSFYDIMAMHPYKINKYIKNVDIDWKIVDNKFRFYESIIKGHMTRSFVRNYVEHSTLGRLSSIFFPFLPDHLCDEIFNYLNNEDILNMYLTLRTTGDE